MQQTQEKQETQEAQNKEITLVVSIQEANVMLQAISQMPYIQVAGLIDKLREQAVSQLQE